MIAFLSFILLNALGMISPGPDFAIVMRYGLSGSRKATVYASIGIAAALLIHVAYCISGVALFLSASPKLLHLIKILGGGYLIYLGIKSILSASSTDEKEQNIKYKSAFTAGFLCNLLNPKATVFLLSLYSLFAESMNTTAMKFAFGISIPLMAAIWFTLLSIFITHPQFLPFLQKRKKIFMLIMGIFLIILGSIGSITASSFFLV